MNLLLKVDKEAYAEHPQYAHAQQKGEVSQILLDINRTPPPHSDQLQPWLKPFFKL